MAISRILYPELLRNDDHLSRPACAERPPSRFRGHRPPLQPSVMRRYPRIYSEFLRGGADRLPFLCFVLHRMGFFVPRRLRVER